MYIKKIHVILGVVDTNEFKPSGEEEKLGKSEKNLGFIAVIFKRFKMALINECGLKILQDTTESKKINGTFMKKIIRKIVPRSALHMA
ncbi:MAG: hypothetical protein ACXACH_03625, partial [Candidatus Hermodarchaeia archaeon]